MMNLFPLILVLLGLASHRAEAQMIFLNRGDSLIVHSWSDPVAAALTGGRLVLDGGFNKDFQHPSVQASNFSHVDLAPFPSGTIEFRNCGLRNSPAADTSLFFELPFAFDSVALIFRDSWLYGTGNGVPFDTNHRGSIWAQDTWFSCSDTSIFSPNNLNTGTFLDCRFALGHTGVAVHDAELYFNNCEFVSLDLGISVSGLGSVEIHNSLFQSCRTMLQLSDSVSAYLDSCAFYEVESFCFAGNLAEDEPDVLFEHCWFDTLSVPEAKWKEATLPDSLIVAPLPESPRLSDIPTEIAIHVDDSEPLDSDPSNQDPPGVRVFLGADITLRSTGQKPQRPRLLRVFALPDSLTATVVNQALGNRGLLEAYKIATMDLDALLDEPFPNGNRLEATLPAIEIPESSQIVCTVDDGFLPVEARVEAGQVLIHIP